MRGKEFIKSVKLVSLVVPVAILYSCSSGGGGQNPNNNNGGGGGQSSTYLAYMSSVVLVDPNDLNNPTTVSNLPVIEAQSLMAFNNYNTSDNSYTGLHTDSIYWIEERDGDISTEEGGPVKMVSMVKGSGTPTPKQLSDVNNACDIDFSVNEVVGKKKFMVVITAGADNQCGTADDGRVFIHNQMSETDSPVDMQGQEILAQVTGGLSSPQTTGFVVFDSANGVVKKCDTNMSNCQNLQSSVTAASYMGTDPSNGNVYLCIDGNVRRFDGSSLSSPITTCDPNWTYRNDSSAIYAVSGGNVQELPFNGSSWNTIYNGGDVNDILGITQNHVIVQRQIPPSQKGITAVPKGGGTQVDLETNWEFGMLGFTLATNNRFFYNQFDQNNSIFYACSWTEGSSSSNCQQDAYWAGASFAQDGRLDFSGGGPFPVYRLLRVESVSMSGIIPVGGTLYSLNPSNLSSKTQIGSVPSNTVFMSLAIGNHALGGGFDLSSSNWDIFYFNHSSQNSLTNITNTGSVDEMPISPL